MTNIPSVVNNAVIRHPQRSITPQNFIDKNPSTVKILYCDVVFGSPSMDCNGTGICKLTSTRTLKQLSVKKDCRRTLGQIAASPNGHVSLFFFREFLCTHLYRQHFRKGVLVMKEACSLPSWISKGLDIKEKKMQAGSYAVVECDGYFRVDVTCA